MASPYQPPPIETATEPVYSAADLCQRWRALMGPLGFGERLLWLAFVGPDRRLIKALSQIPIGPTPEPHVVEGVLGQVREVLDHLEAGTTAALLLTRPGSGPVSTTDRRWSTSLTQAAAQLQVPLEPFFRADDVSLVRVEPLNS